MTSISSYLKPRSTNLLDEDTYDAVLTKAEIRKENGAVVYNEKDQPTAVIAFTIDGHTDDAGGPIVVDKWFTVAYGKSHKGPWAGLATLIEATLGIPCGDARQHHVTFEDLLGKRCRVALIHHIKNGATYLRIDRVLKPRAKAAVAAQPRHELQPSDDPALGDDEIPF